MVRRHSTPGPVPQRSAPFRAVPRVPRHSVPRLSTTTRHRPQLCSSPLLCFSFALRIRRIDPRRAIRLTARSCRPQSSVTTRQQQQCRFLSLAHHLIPSISSFSLHCRCHSRTVFSLSLPHTSLPLRSGDLPSLTLPHSFRRACACSIVPKCRYQSTPLCRLAPDPHE